MALTMRLFLLATLPRVVSAHVGPQIMELEELSSVPAGARDMHGMEEADEATTQAKVDACGEDCGGHPRYLEKPTTAVPNPTAPPEVEVRSASFAERESTSTSTTTLSFTTTLIEANAVPVDTDSKAALQQKDLPDPGSPDVGAISGTGVSGAGSMPYDASVGGSNMIPPPDNPLSSRVLDGFNSMHDNTVMIILECINGMLAITAPALLTAILVMGILTGIAGIMSCSQYEGDRHEPRPMTFEEQQPVSLPK